ncbi:related to acid phosphatase [Pseudozyma flocculosa]|uniref:Related to acid phosphatase n=2 Tax=Pseudozyma flocculosa TaxID=84751 RepID=A0A5C3F3Y2_9BASI|nr:related to acid phosphatase [Pseudozyma flocculosa]
MPIEAPRVPFLNTMSHAASIYTSSVTPAHLPWNTYNYCNAPRVSAAHYIKPQGPGTEGAELVYLNVVQRHHKRTPDNTYPNERAYNPTAWECDDFKQVSYGIGTGNASRLRTHSVYHQVETPSWHPLASLIWEGSCDKGQLTSAGLQDSIQHGKDFASVYGPNGVNPLLKHGVNERDLYIRTSNADRTYQVSAGLLAGMGYRNEFPVHTQPQSIDDIVPNYSCAHADDLRDSYQQLPAWTDHIKSKAGLFASLNAVVGTANQSSWNTWIDHHFDAMASRQCHGHSLPENPETKEAIGQDLANQAYAEGDWEYDYIWNTAEGADDYVRYGFGVFVQELAENLKAFRDGKERHKVKYYVGHDGTMVRLFKSLAQSGQIRWPAMGSEVVIEVWRKPNGKGQNDKQHYVRILQYGSTMATNADLLASSPGHGGDGGHLIAWTPLDDVIKYLESRVPADLYEKCVQG